MSQQPEEPTFNGYLPPANADLSVDVAIDYDPDKRELGQVHDPEFVLACKAMVGDIFSILERGGKADVDSNQVEGR